ncbi:unnamed protein product [Protopolystoma xenopodis]|uniref:Uncharacterized protein n=1 Tax=Protopolystoma xenopodis TaxID=117903 RepID=A0A3S5C5B5_9PLAT|nr:unnamed protein product [Protopolystoma xenopodis]
MAAEIHHFKLSRRDALPLGMSQTSTGPVGKTSIEAAYTNAAGKENRHRGMAGSRYRLKTMVSRESSA